MTDTTYTRRHTPLGVGRIIGDTFSVFFKKLPAILLLGFVPAWIELVLENAFIGPIDSQDELDFTMFLVSFLMSMVIWSFVTAAIVQLSYDAKLNRPARMGGYMAAAVRNSPAVIALSIVSTILYLLGFVLLIVPGLWLYAVFSVVVPAIVIEGAGFRALGRSAELTKNYRWPIVGVLLLTILCSILLMLAVEAASTLAITTMSAGVFHITMILEAAGNAIGYGISSVAVALIFARLKEIKEGVAVSDLVDVFK